MTVRNSFPALSAMRGCNFQITRNKRLNMATLSQYLRRRSKEICADNNCREDSHHCESYAYINQQCQLMDICACDYFQGCSKPHAAIPLPWTGNQKELEAEVADQCAEMEEN